MNKGIGAGAAAGSAISTPMSAPVKKTAPSLDNAPLYEEKDPEAGLTPLAVVCSVLAVVLVFMSFLTIAPDKFNLFSALKGESTAIMVPAREVPKWEKASSTGGYTSSFGDELKKYTSKYE